MDEWEELATRFDGKPITEALPQPIPIDVKFLEDVSVYDSQSI